MDLLRVSADEANSLLEANKICDCVEGIAKYYAP